MIKFIIVIILGIVLIKNIYDYYIDFFFDYKGKYHIILWYNDNEKQRKYINIVGNQIE